MGLNCICPKMKTEEAVCSALLLYETLMRSTSLICLLDTFILVQIFEIKSRRIIDNLFADMLPKYVQKTKKSQMHLVKNNFIFQILWRENVFIRL